MYIKVCANNYADFIRGIITRSVLQFKSIGCIIHDLWWFSVFIIKFDCT